MQQMAVVLTASIVIIMQTQLLHSNWPNRTGGQIFEREQTNGTLEKPVVDGGADKDVVPEPTDQVEETNDGQIQQTKRRSYRRLARPSDETAIRQRSVFVDGRLVVAKPSSSSG